MKDKECKCNEGSEFVKMGSVFGGILLVMLALFLIFAKDMLDIFVPIAWAYVVLGIVLAVFQYKSKVVKK